MLYFITTMEKRTMTIIPTRLDDTNGSKMDTLDEVPSSTVFFKVLKKGI